MTIAATPGEDYELYALSVIDKNGKEIDLTDKGNGKCTFKMPSGKVTVDVSFQPIPAPKPEPEPEPQVNPFTDIAEDAYYFDAVLWVVKNGITTSTGDGSTFSPNDDCTRAQIVTFLYRFMGT